MGVIDILKKAFVSSETMPDKKLGRNDPCWCGSGKKYKRCHLGADEKKHSAALAAATCKGPT
jgi:uncharacterized protein YecA (UPF0149 family)